VIRTAEAQDYPRYPPAGSTFVPLDSWVYPAFERLGAMGYVTTSLEGMKPWTRTECARLTVEAGDALREAILEDKRPAEESVQIHTVLAREFAAEIEVIGGGRNRSLRLESVYTRAMSISGPPLTDGFHFGQTVAYDFGRPFQRGFNSITGGAWRATAGPFAFYVRAEYQHAPGAPAVSDAVRNFVALADQKPLEPARTFPAIDRVRLLDAYATINIRNWQLSFGRQSLSWGVGGGGSMLLSDNAEPLTMVRLSRAVPARLPGFLSGTGPFRFEFFIGRQDGGTIIPNPLIWGHKFSFKVTPYLEVGYGRTNTLGAGDSHLGSPFTFGNFFHTFFGLRAAGIAGRAVGLPGSSQDSFDFVLYIPGTKHVLSLYGDLYAKDKAIYLFDPPRGAYRAGFYLSRIPGLAKLDFRAESTSTESPVFESRSVTLNYWNSQYRDGYTNNGFLMGNVVGREGRGIQAWATYHFSPTHSLEFSFTHRQVDPGFVPGGARWQDYGARHVVFFGKGMYVKSWLQFENIASFPILFYGRANNVSASVEFGFVPKWGQ
jgi:hypothetical protein